MSTTVKCLISEDGKDRVEAKLTLDAIKDYITQGYYGMIHLSQYQIDGYKFIANALSIGNDTIPYWSENCVEVETYFMRYMIPHLCVESSHSDDKVRVKVQINQDDIDFISLYSPK